MRFILLNVIPKVLVNNHSLSKIVLGHDTFIGFTSLYPDPNKKLQLYQTRFSKVEYIIDFLSSAVREGIDVISFGINEPKDVIVAEEHVQKLSLKRFPIIYQIPLKVNILLCIDHYQLSHNFRTNGFFHLLKHELV